MKLTPPLRKATELGIALTAIATLILAGCGGGGSSNAGTAVSNITTTVTPYKGMFTSGNVVLKDVNGNTITLVTGGTIDTTGKAAVTFPANVAFPITVEVSGTYIDETTGTSAVISAGSPLRGMIPATTDANAASGVPVTAITDLARATLPTTGFTAASAVAAITGAASNVLGVTSYAQAMLPPVFNTLGQTSDANTLKLTALAHVISQQGIGATLYAKLQNINASLVAGSAVNAVIPQSAFNNALSSINMVGGASGVLPVGAIPPTIPAFTLPGGSLGGAISGGGGGAGSSNLSCNTSLFSGGVRNATAGELSQYAQTFSGESGSFDQNFNFLPNGTATLVFGTSGALTYNSQAQTVTSLCYETAVPQLVVHFGAMGHVDFKTDGTFTGYDGSNVIRNVAAGGGAGAFPNEAITLPSADLNAITNPTMAATDVSSMVGTYTGTKSAYQTNVDTSQVVDYSTAVFNNSCQLTFTANRTLTLTDGAHTFTQTAIDSWTHSLTGEANTGFYNAGAQSLGVGTTGITMQIGRGKLIAVTAQVYTAAPAVMSEKLTCWMPINRMVGTAGSNMTTGTYYDNASDLPATAPGTYTSPLLVSLGAAAPAGSTCQLVVAANGSMTFTTTGLATNANMTVQIAGDYDDRIVYTTPTSWSYTAKDISDQISGAYNSIQMLKSGASLFMTVISGSVRPLSSSSYTCM